MQIEHLALNMAEAPAVIAWYHQHLGMPIQRSASEPVYVAFLGEPPSLLEIYRNPECPFAEPASWDPLTLHLALTSHDLPADIPRLVAAGAQHLFGEIDDRGYGLIMLRCPWGMPLQICRRAQPLCAPAL